MAPCITPLVSAALAALMLASCAPLEERASDAPDPALAALDTSHQCFFTREVNGFARAPDGPSTGDRVWITTGVHERWLLETYGACPELDFTLHLALDPTGSSTNLCTGETANLLVPDVTGGGLDRCPVRVLGRSTHD